MEGQDDTKGQTALLWSGGKDALLALRALETSCEEKDDSSSRLSRAVGALVTTVAGPEEQVAIHGVGLPLIRAQARALEIPLVVMRQPARVPNEEYEHLLGETLAPLKARGFTRVAAGDLYLEDVQAYRKALLQRLGVTPHFPLWKQDTDALARSFIETGYQAVVCSVDITQLDAAFAGRPYDAAFLADLPEEVDLCGERGAFHTFVTGGPRFRREVPVEVGPVQQGERMAQATVQLSSK